MIDPIWTKWIATSINTYFKSVSSPYTLILEGEERQTTSYAELRIGGPRFTEGPKDQFTIDFEINIMCTVIGTNIYDRDRIIGHFASKMTDFVIKKDDGTFFECAAPKQPVDIIRWGQTDPTSDAFQTSVETSYRITHAN